MATNRYEVVFLVSSSVHVIVEAESKEHAQEKAWPIAAESVSIYGAAGDSHADVPDAANVWMGDVEDVAYVDELHPDTAEGNEAWAEANLPDGPVYADGWSSTFGGSR